MTAWQTELREAREAEATALDQIDFPAHAWFVIRAQSTRTQRVADALNDMGYTALIPLEREAKRLHRRANGNEREVQTRHVIPGFIFLGSTAPANWLEILSVDNLIGVLGSNGLPTRARTSEIKACMYRDCMRGVERTPQRPTIDFAKGEELRISKGHLRGFEGLFVGEDNKGGVVMNLVSAGTFMRVTVDADSVQSVA